jgi:mRNA-degrading endonuclease RelE of RelBE toxin-antitoxin system
MPYEIRFTWQASAAIESLPESERKELLAALDRLRLEPRPASAPDVSPLQGQNGSYVLRSGRDLRLLVRFSVEPAAQVISVLDVISRDLVQEYRRSVAG